MDEYELSKIVDYHVRHAKARARTRYNLELSDADYDAICDLIKSGQLLEPLKPTVKAGNMEAWVAWQGQKLRCAWNPRLEIIASFWPPQDKPFEQRIAVARNEKCPHCTNILAGTKSPVDIDGTYFHQRCARKWLKKYPKSVVRTPEVLATHTAPPPSAPEKPKPAVIVRLPEASVDVRWYKGKMREAVELLLNNEGFAALLLLEAASALPTGFKPGAEPERALELMQQIITEQAPRMKDKIDKRSA